MSVTRLAGCAGFTGFALACSLLATAAFAQEAPPDAAQQPTPGAAPAQVPPAIALSPVTVTATRVPTPVSEVGSSVTVITGEEIQQKQERTLPEVLNDVPGLNVVQQGGPGALTSVYIRGANANHTKVLIDGIDVSDPSSPTDSFDFSQILASDIARVEVLRGPQSGLYGSDAIGGVINIITRPGSGPPHMYGSLEGGSYDTFNQTAGLSGSVGRFSYNFDFLHYHSGDTDVTPGGLIPPGRQLNPDYYDNKTFSTRVGAGLTDNFDVGAVLRYVDSNLSSTSDDALGPEAAQSYSDNHELFTRGFAHLVLLDGRFDETIGFGYTGYWRRTLDPNPGAFLPDPAKYNGTREKLDWQGNLKLVPGEVLVMGAEYQIDRLENSGPLSAHVSNNAGFVELQSNFADRLFNAASVRFDDNGAFGGHATFREAPAYLVPETGTKFKASVGSGFKAPTLDELYDNFPAFGFFANPNLKPETSLGFDLGFEQSLWGDRVGFGSTYFHNDITNLIEVNNAGTTYENIGRATTQGFENFIAYKPWEALTLRAGYTYTLAMDDTTHSELLRRPKHKVSLDARWQATDRLSFTATAVYKGNWEDISRSGLQSGIFASPYTLINIAGNYDFGHGITAFARIDNLLDRHFQDPIGFQHQRLGVFGGVKVAFDAPQIAR